jgi:hypothetical protein
MAFNLPSPADAGHRVPIIKYDSRAGRIFRVDRSDASGRWETNPVEITPVFQAIFDFENIELGWLHFPTGGAPDIRTVRIGQALPDRPTDKHRSGYRLMLKLGKASGGDVREMAANAAVAINGMDLLHDQYMAERDAHPGELPIVRLGSIISVTTQGKANGQAVSSTNFQPVWQIVGWAARPADLRPDYLPPQPEVVQPPQQQIAIPPPPPPQPAPVVQQQAPAPAPPPPPPAAPPVAAAPQLASVMDDF